MQAFVTLPGTTTGTNAPTTTPTPDVAPPSQTLLASRQPLRSLPTTGFSPLLQPPKNITSSQLLLDFTQENNNENNRNITNLNLSHSSPSTTSAAATTKVTSDVRKFNQLIDRTPGPPCTTTDVIDPQIRWIESLHINIKLLLLLIKHRPYEMLPFIDLLILRITPSTLYIPRAITLYCEQMIVDLVKLTTNTNTMNTNNMQSINRYPQGENTCTRVIYALLPYLQQNDSNQHTPTTSTNKNNNNNSFDECVYMHLYIIHVLNQIIPYLLSSQLIEIMPEMVIILTFLNSSIVDIRQSVIFLLVTINRCIGYNMLSVYIKGKLTHTQLSLLNIYIERDEKSNTAAISV